MRLAVPPDDLQQITTTTTEYKQMATKRIFGQRLLGLCCQGVKPAPHIRHTSRKPDPCIRGNRDQDTNPFSSRASASAS